MDRTAEWFAILRQMTGDGRSPQYRAKLVRAFAFLAIVYIIGLQPLSKAVRLRDAHHSAKVSEWFIEIPICEAQTAMVLAKVGLKPLEVLEQESVQRPVLKFVSCNVGPHLMRSTKNMQAFETLHVTMKNARDSKIGLTGRQAEQLDEVTDGWQMLVNGRQRRRAPISKDGVPVPGSALPTIARRRAAR